MLKRIPHYFTLILLVFISTFVLWFPFLMHFSYWFGLHIAEPGFNIIYRNFDGILYVVPAQSWYSPKAIEALRLELPLPLEYYAAHLPVYPFFIWLLSFVMGFLKSMIFVNLLFTSFLTVLFYYFVKYFKLTQNPLLLTTIFLFLPRFLVLRSIGAPESIFLLFIMLSILFFEKKNYLWAGVFGAIAAATKTPGILLFLGYILVFLEQFLKYKKFEIRSLWILLIPLGLLGVFFLYFLQYGNFFAYFKTGAVVPLVFPYSAFNFQSKWVLTGWLEENLFYFFMYILAVIYLKDSKYRSFFYFSLVFLVATTFVQHQDIARYALPLWPFAVIAFEKFFTSKKFLIAALILLPAIYLYAWNFVLFNVMPISDWRPFL